MAKQYLDKTGLAHLWGKIRDLSATKADASHTQDASTITGLAEVATSGSYNDLSNKPTIPTTLPANGGNADTVDGYHIRIGTSGAEGYITFVI